MMGTLRANGGTPTAAIVDLTPEIFSRLSLFLKAVSGQSIGYEKKYLVETKLRPILRREGIPGFGPLMHLIERDRDGALASEVVQSMTINETHFFRDVAPFDTLREVVPGLVLRRLKQKGIRIWSAACSTGQEVYSIAIALAEIGGGLLHERVEIIGTDLSESAVTKARSGAYTPFEVQRGMPAPLLLKYFEKKGDSWCVRQSISDSVKFGTINLLRSFSHLGDFDIIFCRNVLFYFEMPTRIEILDRMRAALRPGGYIVLGAAESMTAAAAGLRSDGFGSCLYEFAESPAQSGGSRGKLAR